MSDIKYIPMVTTEVTANCYGGINGDEIVKRFESYAKDDMSTEIHDNDLNIRLAELPIGAKVTVEYPPCPKCGLPREDIFEGDQSTGIKVVGHNDQCDCGYDWTEFALDHYS